MVNSAVRQLRKFDVIGFDTETRPSFKRGQMHKIALMQLSTPNECFLFRLNQIGMPTVLHEFVCDSSRLKVGLSVHDDFKMLKRSFDIEPAGFEDVQELAQQNCIVDISLQKIFAILFGERISKSQQLSNWEAETLTDAQKRYAAIDAWACIKIHNLFASGMFNPEESPYYSIENDQQQTI